MGHYEDNISSLSDPKGLHIFLNPSSFIVVLLGIDAFEEQLALVDVVFMTEQHSWNVRERMSLSHREKRIGVK